MPALFVRAFIAKCLVGCTRLGVPLDDVPRFCLLPDVAFLETRLEGKPVGYSESWQL